MDVDSRSVLAEAVAAARAQLAEIVREQEALYFRLLGVQATLPPSPVELVRFLEEDQMDARTEIRAVIQCVLDTYIRPAIRDLQAQTVSPPAAGGDGEP